jgi:hypothetical protein
VDCNYETTFTGLKAEISIKYRIQRDATLSGLTAERRGNVEITTNDDVRVVIGLIEVRHQTAITGCDARRAVDVRKLLQLDLRQVFGPQVTDPRILAHFEKTIAEVKAAGIISAAVAIAALDMLEVDPQGFDMLDRKLLLTVIEKFEGGPVGVDSLAAAMSEERGTIEDIIEPFLIQQGFLMRTARGRVATRSAYAHFGLAAPAIDRDMNMPLFRDAQ